MKKFVTVLAALCIALSFAACLTTGAGTVAAPTVPAGRQAGEGMFPDFIMPYIMNAPEDALVGIGTAKMGTLASSRQFSTNRARVEIAQQMNSMVQGMIRDYTATSEADPASVLSFQESISTTLTKADVSGAAVKYQNADQDGNVWTVVYMDKASVAKEIGAAQAAAKLAFPAMASFDAEARMNDAFAKQTAEPLKAGTTDPVPAN